MGRGLHLGKVGGVEVVLDWSLIIIFGLITVGLASGLFAEWHSDWGAPLIWGTAIMAAISFLAAVLVHELSHAWVGRARGVDITRITLFVFGGMAHMETEPRRWQDEFWMAIVGPFTSALIGVVCIVLGSLAAGDVDLRSGDIEESLRALGPVASLLFWLGPVNIVLAVFNLVPGFPLDGGRVLRAGLWGLFGDLRRATRWASNAGRVFAGALIVAGFAMIFGFTIPVLGTGLVSGAWAVLIGWFLHNAAIMSFQQQLMHDALEGLTVERLMLTDIETVAPDISVSEFVDEHLMPSEQPVFPVVEHTRLLGVIGIEAIRNAARDRWDTTRVRDLMTPLDALATLRASDSALDAASLLNRGRASEIPVVTRDGQLRGLLTRDNLHKWLAIHGPRPGSPADAPGGAASGLRR